jgi:hypothetical protein
MRKVKPSRASVNLGRTKKFLEELVFVEEWRKENCVDGSCKSPLLKLLLLNVTPYDPLTDRDYQVAETVIQWLGSECGNFFIERVLAKVSRRRARGRAK